MSKPMVISFLNQKGGVGKTTLSYNAAFELGQRGYKVLFIDTDPQQSAIVISGQRETFCSQPQNEGKYIDLPFDTFGMVDANQIKREVNKFKSEQKYDFIVIDGVPSITVQVTPATIMVSDLVIVPTQTSGVDLWASDPLRQMVNNAAELRPELTIGFLFNRYESNRNISHSIEEMAQNMDGWQIFETKIGNRTHFQSSMTYGLAVSEFKGGEKAHSEISSLVDEIVELQTQE